MHVEKLSIEKSWEKWVFTFVSVLFFYLHESLSIYILFFYLLRTYQLFLHCCHCLLIRKQFIYILLKKCVHFVYYFSWKLKVNRVFEFFCFFSYETEKSWGIVFSHFFELWYQSVSQPRRFFVQYFLLILFAFNLHSWRLEEDIDIFVFFW